MTTRPPFSRAELEVAAVIVEDLATQGKAETGAGELGHNQELGLQTVERAADLDPSHMAVEPEPVTVVVVEIVIVVDERKNQTSMIKSTSMKTPKNRQR